MKAWCERCRGLQDVEISTRLTGVWSQIEEDEAFATVTGVITVACAECEQVLDEQIFEEKL